MFVSSNKHYKMSQINFHYAGFVPLECHKGSAGAHLPSVWALYLTKLLG